jgi:hypothetical protein
VQFGLDPDLSARRRARSELSAYVELHIEEGPVLEAKNLPVGVVSAIATTRDWFAQWEIAKKGFAPGYSRLYLAEIGMVRRRINGCSRSSTSNSPVVPNARGWNCCRARWRVAAEPDPGHAFIHACPY